MKKIFIYAYAELNLGDDLFVKMLCDRYPEHKFYMVCRKSNAAPFLSINNLTIIYSIPYIDIFFSKFGLEHLFLNRIASKCDLIVNIGGSIFIEKGNWPARIKNYKNRIINNKPYYIIGSNFGPYKDKEFYKEHYEIFKKVTDVCFRDYYSYELFSELDNVRLAPDVVLSLNHNELKSYDLNESIIISVINLENRQELSEFRVKYEEKIKQITIDLIKKRKKVILMSFCENEGDLKAINRIAENIPIEFKEKLEIFEYNGDLNKSMSVIKSSSGVIATRFHSLILALLFNIPVYPFIYSSKTENFLKDIHYSKDSTWIHNIEKEKVSTIVSQVLSNTKNDINDNLNLYIEESEKQFLKLDKILL